MKKIGNRDIGIELARLLGCWIVVGIHISLSDMVGGNYDPSRGLINCFLADGVSVFWLITGCFLFRSSDYKKVLVRTAKSIALPLAIYSVFCLFFSGYIRGGGPLIQCTYASFEDYWQGLKDALSLKQTIPLTGHLWYCYAYILVMLAFPLLKGFVQWLEEAPKREVWFCGISFGLLLVNDFTRNQTFAFSHHGLNATVPASLVIIWGTVLYRNKERLLKHKFLGWVAPFAFLLLNLLRMLIVQETGSKAILYWYSSVGLLCAMCVVVFSLFLGRGLTKRKALPSLILRLAKRTFLIYLVHIPIINLLARYKIQAAFLEWLSRYTTGPLLECIYTVGLIILVFFISYLVSLLCGFVMWGATGIGRIGKVFTTAPKDVNQ